jgi:hypothetical protein
MKSSAEHHRGVTPDELLYPGVMSDQPINSHPRVIFTEIMYHPVEDDSQFEDYEFIELVNLESYPVTMSNWMIISDSFFSPYPSLKNPLLLTPFLQCQLYLCE